METLRYFSSNYFDARAKLLLAAREIGGRIESIRNPCSESDDGELYIDIVQLGPENAKKFLVVSSGVHGIEGFAGSAIQTGILSEIIAEQLPDDTSLLIIHAVNPYGMAFLRRFNEDNVDLNRNFLPERETLPVNLAYEKLADDIAPRSLSFWSEVGSWARLLWFRLVKGRAMTQAAISSGQYSHPKGLFYGGAFDTWSNKTFRSVIQRYLSNAEHATFVDIHTGLGSFGRAEIILNSPEDSPEYQRAKSIWEQKNVRTTVSGKSVSAHIESSLKLAILRELPFADVTSVSLEFGTLSPIRVIKALRAENWLYHYGGHSHPRFAEIKASLSEAFYPGSEEWRLSVWTQGKSVIEQALASFR